MSEEATPSAASTAPVTPVTDERSEDAKDKQIRMLQRELDEVRSEVAVGECLRESVIELERLKNSQGEELATMQQLLNESHDEASSTRTRYEHELAKTRAIVGQLENENHELKIQMKIGSGPGVSAYLTNPALAAGDAGIVDKETIAVISDATKSFARRVKTNLQTAVIGPGGAKEPVADEGMKKAYEDTELLKSIVVPLEEQIGMLKDKLRETDSLLREQEDRQTKTLLGVESLAKWLEGKSIEEAMAELLQKSEDNELADGKEAAKSDLYFSLLSARYSLLNSELTSLRREHTEILELLQRERDTSKKLRHEAVITSSEMIKVQREHLAEITRVQSILTDEQKEEIMNESNKEAAKVEGAAAQAAKTSSNHSASSSADSSPAHDSASALSDDSNTMARIVSNVEWEDMQKELSKVRALLGVGAGDSVVGSDQYRELQSQLIELKKQKAVHSKAEAKLKEELKQEAVYRREVEGKWNERADQHKSETDELAAKIQTLESLLEQVRLGYTTMYGATRKDLQSLTTDREKIVRELKRLQDEVDILVGKHAVKAEEMQNEVINLPEKTEDMHLLLLKYREDLITAKIAKERLEEKFKSEVSFLKAQIEGEVQEKLGMENQLTSEIEALKQKVLDLKAFRKNFESEQKKRKELGDVEQKQRLEMAALNLQIEEHVKEKRKLEEKAFEMKNRISNLQVELDNTVAVQTDFVRLSQSLQMELEKIRQAEKEVRWQHEDDVDNCQSCKIGLAANKKKHHCRHCGRIFCSDCVSKHVPSGPKQRPAKVCDVCHTLLNQNSAPYFSTDAPQTS